MRYRILIIGAAVLLASACSKEAKKAAPAPKAAEAKPAEADKPAPAAAAAPAPAKPAAASGKYQAVEVTDGGTIRGKVAWEGDRAKLEPFPVNKDVETCDVAKDGKRPSVRLQVSEAGGVKNAVVYLADIKKGRALDKGSYVLDQKGCIYEPHILVVPKKAKVTLKSSDQILHNVHMFGAAKYNLPFPEPVSVDKPMRKTGVVWMQCDAGHGWMSAFIHVVEHPYYAITDAEGAFELKDVPPGKYSLKMWHEHWKVTDRAEKDGKVSNYVFAKPIETEKPVQVAAGGTAEINFSLKADQ